MATESAQVWQSLGTKRPDEEGYRPDLDANFNRDFIEYASPERSGVDSGFYVGDNGLPWHVRLSRALNTVELMQDAGGLQRIDSALELTGGNWTVNKEPISVASSGIVIPNLFATTRSDNGQPLGVVGTKYKAVSNRTVAEFIDLLVDSGEAKYETGGVMLGGKRFFISAELDHLGIKVPGDPSEYKTYLLATTSHDGTCSIQYLITHVRVVCKNTAELARKGAISRAIIRHSGDLNGKIIQVRNALGIAFKNTEMVQEMATHLATTSLVDEQVREIMNNLWPASETRVEKGEQSKHADAAYATYLRSENLEGIRGTAWGAMNSVTEYLDHVVEYRGRVAEAGDVRAESCLFGTAHKTKQRALDLLLEYAK